MLGEAITRIDEWLYQYGGYVSTDWLVALLLNTNALSTRPKVHFNFCLFLRPAVFPHFGLIS